jgi:hypothetical protein
MVAGRRVYRVGIIAMTGIAGQGAVGIAGTAKAIIHCTAFAGVLIAGVTCIQQYKSCQYHQ